MKVFLLTPFTLFFVILCDKTNALEKLKLEILYESLCPDSQTFISNQLYPAWNEIAPYVDIKFIPFGKSTSINNGEKFACQHGARECLGNKIQSCALAALPEPNAQIEFVYCFMKMFQSKRKNRLELGQTCAANVGLNWAYVTNCYTSSVGTQLQLQAEQDTARIAPSFVPTVVYNGVFNQKSQEESLKNFKNVVCSFITQTDRNACQSNQLHFI